MGRVSRVRENNAVLLSSLSVVPEWDGCTRRKARQVATKKTIAAAVVQNLTICIVIAYKSLMTKEDVISLILDINTPKKSEMTPLNVTEVVFIDRNYEDSTDGWVAGQSLDKFELTQMKLKLLGLKVKFTIIPDAVSKVVTMDDCEIAKSNPYLYEDEGVCLDIANRQGAQRLYFGVGTANTKVVKKTSNKVVDITNR